MYNIIIRKCIFYVKFILQPICIQINSGKIERAKKKIVFKLNFEIIDSHGVVRINMQRSYILFPPVVTSHNTIVQYRPGFTV